MKRITALLLTFLLLCSFTFASAASVEAYVFGLTTEMTLTEEIGRAERTSFSARYHPNHP